MPKELEFWQFVASRLNDDIAVVLLVVAESSGSSPGRIGYKMAVTENGELCGSIGGGVMEVKLVELAKVKSKKAKGKIGAEIIEQVHQKNVADSSGMICSGRQTVLIKHLARGELEIVHQIIESLEGGVSKAFEISDSRFQIIENTIDNSPSYFSKTTETEFIYQERLGYQHKLFIIGGGHCALALSEQMSRLGFYISIFDDRPDLNTLEKNKFADRVALIKSYDEIADHIPNNEDLYVVVMTLGYASDEVVIRKLIDHDFRYFGVLGSNAKMKTLFTELKREGYSKDKLSTLRTPVGLPINSRTPEEIAVSIAAEIISVKNAKPRLSIRKE